jgi:hypothetical protein
MVRSGYGVPEIFENEAVGRLSLIYEDIKYVLKVPIVNFIFGHKISEETGITETTLYKWRKDARIAGNATPGDGQGSEQWSSEDKFLVVMETYAMNEVELAEYCRKKGLYKE